MHGMYHVFRRLVRALCVFPSLMKAFYGIFSFLVIRMPFLRASYKWKAIRKGPIHFEINRSLYQKGKPCEQSILNEISFVPAGREAAAPGGSRPSVGTFKLDVVFNGMTVKGKVERESASFVSVLVDGHPLRKHTLGGHREFSLRIGRSVLASFPTESLLSVQTDSGGSLLYRGSELARVNVPSGSGSLRESLSAGHSVSKRGGMAATVDAAREKQDGLLELYEAAREAFDEKVGRQLFLNYGTLLGFVREGDFIPNDDDFDAGYVSEKSDPKEVKAEALEIMLALLREGFTVIVNSVGKLFKIEKGTGARLDIMPVWFHGPWNIAYRGSCVKAGVRDFVPVSEGRLRGRKVYAPARPEIFLEGYYGKGWRVPDPGYVSDLKQTGKDLRRNYAKFLMTPLEFLRFSEKVEEERQSNSRMGRLVSMCLQGEL